MVTDERNFWCGCRRSKSEWNDGLFLASYVATTISQQPLLYYPFAETSGTTFYDGSGNGRAGTVAGSGLLFNQTAVNPNLSTAIRFGNGTSTNSVIVPSIGSVPIFQLRHGFSRCLIRTLGI